MDRKNIIKGLEICSEHGSWHGLNCEDNEAYKDCPYRGCETGCVVTIAKDALALLKEQEAIEPTSYMDGLVQRFNCRKCGKHLLYAKWGHDNFCSKCGQAVKWND